MRSERPPRGPADVADQLDDEALRALEHVAELLRSSRRSEVASLLARAHAWGDGEVEETLSRLRLVSNRCEGVRRRVDRNAVTLRDLPAVAPRSSASLRPPERGAYDDVVDLRAPSAPRSQAETARLEKPTADAGHEPSPEARDPRRSGSFPVQRG